MISVITQLHMEIIHLASYVVATLKEVMVNNAAGLRENASVKINTREHPPPSKMINVTMPRFIKKNY